ncbi:MAG: hypothetical protein H7210_11525, partial [Pyrinomonadaceae bacterium]|nr:hypothetical protein [Phycisphaerales bacterium]
MAEKQSTKPIKRDATSSPGAKLPGVMRGWIAIIPIAAGAAALAITKLGNPVVTIFGIIAVGLGVLFFVVVALAAHNATTQQSKGIRVISFLSLVFTMLVVGAL